MKKVLFSILGVLSILLVSGCVQQQTVESSSPLPTQSEFSLSHGVSSIDILTEDLTFTGAPVHLTYEFETGNVDSNIGLLLFLNGDIQPFSVDDNYPSVMNIVSLPANQKKVISLSFEPITGLAGDYLPLHIVAIFDAANRIDNSTIATAFFQELIQTFKAYPNGKFASAAGNYNGTVCAEFIGNLGGKLTGLGNYSVEKIIFYAD